MYKKDDSNHKSRRGGIPTSPRLVRPAYQANWRAEDLVVPQFPTKAAKPLNVMLCLEENRY